MKIIDTTKHIPLLYSDNCFDLSKWKRYVCPIYPDLDRLYLDNMYTCIQTGRVTYEENYLPVLNDVLQKSELQELAIRSFHTVTSGLDSKIQNIFGRALNVDIILLLGLCGGAGWVVTLHGRTVVLLGIEKIIELNWCDLDSMYGLIYHELGHVYQMQYGILEREYSSNRDQFLWQLFTEGIAMYFEQLLVGNTSFYHQDKDGWKDWCDLHFDQIKADFQKDLSEMSFDNQRYFGDWVKYHGYSDVGYYLAARFIQFICSEYPFNEILSLDIEHVNHLFTEFVK